MDKDVLLKVTLEIGQALEAAEVSNELAVRILLGIAVTTAKTHNIPRAEVLSLFTSAWGYIGPIDDTAPRVCVICGNPAAKQVTARGKLVWSCHTHANELEAYK